MGCGTRSSPGPRDLLALAAAPRWAGGRGHLGCV